MPFIATVLREQGILSGSVPVSKADAWLARFDNQAVDEELFHDIIPFIQTRYNISEESQERAIAGLSMGGLQSIETGIMHLVISTGLGRSALLFSCFPRSFRKR